MRRTRRLVKVWTYLQRHFMRPFPLNLLRRPWSVCFSYEKKNTEKLRQLHTSWLCFTCVCVSYKIQTFIQAWVTGCLNTRRSSACEAAWREAESLRLKRTQQLPKLIYARDDGGKKLREKNDRHAKVDDNAAGRTTNETKQKNKPSYNSH